MRRLFISVDMEGVAGVVSAEHLIRSGFEYERAREWLTAEVNAACEAASEAGVSEVVVADSHYNGLSILVDRLPTNVTIVRHFPRLHCMMQGIEEGSFAGAILLGYHGGAHLASSGLAHTMYLVVKELRLNGRVVDEAELSAATAGHFGVPVIMVSGDDVFVESARRRLGDIETVVTRTSYGALSGRVITPARSQQLIREAVKRAVGRVSALSPFTVETPVVMELELCNHALVETLCYLKGIERVDAHTLRMNAEDIVDANRFLAFLDSILTQSWAAFSGSVASQ